MDRLTKTAFAMCEYMAGDVMRINHFMKVHSFAKIIGEAEGLDARTQEILEAAAYVHDIGTVSYTHLDVYKRQYIHCTKISTAITMTVHSSIGHYAR